MRLEDVTAEIRPRVPWESIDLGCALARRHLGAVMKAWSLTVVPLWIVLALLLRNHPIVFIFCVWWLKPIYDRVPLFMVSRALFGDVPSVKEVVRAWPKLLVRRLWFSLVVGRFSPARSLSLPVAELEGLRGKDYRQRVDLLERNGGEGATMATLAGFVLEVVTGFGMVMLVMMMVPDAVSSRWSSGIGDFFDYNDFSDIPAGFIWLMSLVYMASITLMEPFYVSAGFALYINSRTLTEGWDIELAFKRLGARLAEGVKAGASKLGVLLIALLGLSLASPSVHADEDVSPPDQTSQLSETSQTSDESIQEVLTDEDFTVHHRIIDVPVESDTDYSWLDGLSVGSGVLGFMGMFGVVLFYLVLALIVAGIVYLVYKNRHIFDSIGLGRSGASGPKTTAVMGMNVSPESLPDDVAEAARKAWGEGGGQMAMSLLYRGSIAWMIHRADLPIEEGDTEGDCLARVQQLPDSGVVQYFSDLTGEWIAVAYGKKTPENQAMVDLCDRWPFHRKSSQPMKSEGRRS